MYYIIARENYFNIDEEAIYDFRPLTNVENKKDCEIVESIIKPKSPLRIKKDPYLSFYKRYKEKGFTNDEWFTNFLNYKIKDKEVYNKTIKKILEKEVA